MTDRKRPTDNKQLLLFQQVRGICPLCDVPLLYKKANLFKNFEVAHIYPLNPTNVQIESLSGEPRLSEDLNHEDNLLVMCPGCHTKFDKPRTVTEYRKLYEIKRCLIAEDRNRNEWHKYHIEEEIGKIITSLYSEDSLAIEEPVHVVKEIDEKLDSTVSNMTKAKIHHNVNDYYHHIKRRLATVDAENPGAADLIANEIRTFYLKQKRLETAQQTIFDNIVDWINAKVKPRTQDGAVAIASFYVQNCEVFE